MKPSGFLQAGASGKPWLLQLTQATLHRVSFAGAAVFVFFSGRGSVDRFELMPRISVS